MSSFRGDTYLITRMPFALVNVPGTSTYSEGFVRHHLIPMQCLTDRMLGPFLFTLRDVGFTIDDFATNGLLLPLLPSLSKSSGLPLHLGGHRNYNAQIISELQAIRRFCESIRSDSTRRRFAMAAIRGLQMRARLVILGQHAEHVDRVILRGKTDGDIDGLIDRLFNASMA